MALNKLFTGDKIKDLIKIIKVNRYDTISTKTSRRLSIFEHGLYLFLYHLCNKNYWYNRLNVVTV